MNSIFIPFSLVCQTFVAIQWRNFTTSNCNNSIGWLHNHVYSSSFLTTSYNKTFSSHLSPFFYEGNMIPLYVKLSNRGEPCNISNILELSYSAECSSKFDSHLSTIFKASSSVMPKFPDLEISYHILAKSSLKRCYRIHYSGFNRTMNAAHEVFTIAWACSFHKVDLFSRLQSCAMNFEVLIFLTVPTIRLFLWLWLTTSLGPQSSSIIFSCWVLCLSYPFSQRTWVAPEFFLHMYSPRIVLYTFERELNIHWGTTNCCYTCLI